MEGCEALPASRRGDCSLEYCELMAYMLVISSMRQLVARKILAFTIVILCTPTFVFAKCATMEAYYCVPAVFEKEMPDLNISGVNKQYCSGSITLAGKSVTAFFRDKQSCPALGTNMIGHLGTLCQDTGQWTNAGYWYSREQDFCTKNFEVSWKQAQSDSAKITPAMTRAEVRLLLKDYAFLRGSFSEEYYLHPDIVLEVPFDEPGGAYSQNNKVKGPAVVKKIKLPQP